MWIFFILSFDTTTRAQVKQAAIWAKTSALCAFIGYGVALIAVFWEQSVSGAFRAGNILGVLISTTIGVIINYFLYRFAVAMARAMDTMDNVKSNEGFNNLRIYFKVTGILLIVALSIVVLVVLFTIISQPRINY